jgi:hypothetical protein
VTTRKPSAGKREPLEALLLIGDQMSNLCFNLSQRGEPDLRVREIGRKLCSEWDHARRALAIESRAKAKR